LVREELNAGHFRYVDELIRGGVEAWRERTRSLAGGGATPAYYRSHPRVLTNDRHFEQEGFRALFRMVRT
jgi:hypothetical protein